MMNALMLGSVKMNGCEGCSKAGYASFQNDVHCGICGMGECETHKGWLANLDKLCTLICKDCASDLRDELKKMKYL